MQIIKTSYKDERLKFFVDKREAAIKKYNQLEKTTTSDISYLSEQIQILSDCGRELSFYSDVIEMLENNVSPKSEVVREIFDEWLDMLFQIIYLGADGSWHLRKMNPSKLNPLMDDFFNFHDKYFPE